MRIHLSSPDITAIEQQAVADVLSSRHLALGPGLKEFEDKIAAWHNRRFAVAVNSGTSALHLGLLALDLKPGDEVITTPFSFIASSNCILYCDGCPRFVDIDPETWNINPAALAEAVTPKTKGLLPVHVFGVPCDMKQINEFADPHQLWVLEDACEAIGAFDGHNKVGQQANISVLAFYPNKQMTTGEGGIILTDDKNIAAICRSLRNQGRGDSGEWLEHVRLGYNYRLSDIAAALGTAQLSRIDDLLSKRARVATFYQSRLSGCDWLRFQHLPAEMTKSWFVFVIVLADDYTEQNRDAILRTLCDSGIGCNKYFTPIHLQPFMRDRFGYSPGDFPVCESIAARSIALPFHGNLAESEVEIVCEVLKKAVTSL